MRHTHEPFDFSTEEILLDEDFDFFSVGELDGELDSPLTGPEADADSNPLRWIH